MADYYTQTSFMVPMTDEEFKVFTRLTYGKEGSNEQLANSINDEKREELYGWQWELEKEDLHIYMEDGGDLEAMINLLQEFLKITNRDNAIAFSWADTCSKPRVDAIGGGVVFITKNGSSWINTDLWIEQQQKLYNEGKWVPDSTVE